MIELAVGTPYRRAEQLGYRQLFLERVHGSGARWFQVPLVDVTAVAGKNYHKESFPALEGGDLIVLGDTILAGTTMNHVLGSSAKGVEWLRSILGPQGYHVQRVRIGDKFLHLDVVLSVPREGLAIVCREALVDGVPSILDGWDLIEVALGCRLGVNAWRRSAEEPRRR